MFIANLLAIKFKETNRAASYFYEGELFKNVCFMYPFDGFFPKDQEDDQVDK